MRQFSDVLRRARRAGVLSVALALTAAAGLGLAVPAAVHSPAQADSQPLDPSDPRTPVTVSAHALPTAQINGVGWYQLVLGNTVYVVGSFSTARPAGARPRHQTVARKNILAYDLRSGVLSRRFKPALNGQAFALASSPDRSVLYVGGDFTSVNGAPARRIVALNARTGARLTRFRAGANGTVRTIVARGGKVWFGGNFTAVNSRARQRLAAVRASDGKLLPWAPRANLRVHALVLSPDGGKLVVGGEFTRLNGSRRSGYGLGAVSSTTGALRPFPTNHIVRNGGTRAAITALASDGHRVYGTGFVNRVGGNLEGAFASNWSNGRLRWLEDCHGDSYGVYPSPTAVYVVGHPHNCRPVRGFGETTPRRYHRALAFGKAVTQTLRKSPHPHDVGFTGLPAPSLLVWFPELDIGTYTGQNQGPWAVAGNRDYVVLAGEFRHVNGRAQQGLTRFAVSARAPNRVGPQIRSWAFKPRLTSPAAGRVRISWRTNWDRDNGNLTYRIFRDRDPNPIHTTSHFSTFWRLPTLVWPDRRVAAGLHHYRVTAIDPFGNRVRSPWLKVRVAATP